MASRHAAWRSRIVFLGAFATVFAFHVLWDSNFPESDAAQRKWIAVQNTDEVGWAEAYLSSGSYWLGYSYALSLGFAAYALFRFLRNRERPAGRLALGGVGLSGALSIVGCFLIGCCGSPMLSVYLSLFGTFFLPFAKPLIAIVTTVFIALSWFYLRKSWAKEIRKGKCADENCRC